MLPLAHLSKWATLTVLRMQYSIEFPEVGKLDYRLDNDTSYLTFSNGEILLDCEWPKSDFESYDIQRVDDLPRHIESSYSRSKSPLLINFAERVNGLSSSGERKHKGRCETAKLIPEKRFSSYYLRQHKVQSGSITLDLSESIPGILTVWLNNDSVSFRCGSANK